MSNKIHIEIGRSIQFNFFYISSNFYGKKSTHFKGRLSKQHKVFGSIVRKQFIFQPLDARADNLYSV